MKGKNTYFMKAALAMALVVAMLPLNGISQTLRGDFNMDGLVNISDAIMMANSLSTGSMGEVSPEERDTVEVNGIQFVMVRVKGGTYSLKYGKVRTVPDFWIGQTEVTYELWWEVMGNHSPAYGYNDHAVNFVSWYECQDFVEKLSELTGRNFRLPYADEWRYAAMGGRLSRGYIYSGSNNIDEVAWYYYNDAIGESQSSGNHAVALKAPNELGLYDMSGNVAEWVQEMREISVIQTGEVIRSAWLFGGWWGSYAKDCTPTSVVLENPNSRAGLRLAIPATDEPWQAEGWPDQY